MNLRILFVEDSPDDVALMLSRLRKAGIEPQWERVETAAALREALAGEPWQVALVDFNLPSFSVPEALSLLAELAPDVPAITVSGAISEETAVATITAGAVDYVLKDNLTRLAPVVRRAVEGAELRREQRQAAAQARQTQFAIDHSSQAIVYVSEDGVALYLNAAAQRLGGVAAAEAVGQTIWGWIPVVDEQRWAELWRAAAQAPIVDFEATIRLPGGKERLFSATLDYHERDEGSFMIVYARDITAQRAVEERARASEERYERLADNASDIIFRYDLLPAVRLTYINPAVEAITGHSPDEHYADPRLLLDIVDPRDVELVRRMIESPPLADEPLLMRWVVKDGVTRWMESRIVPVRDAEGRLLAVEGITRDVTERVEVGEALRRREREFATLVENAPDMIVRFDTDLRQVYGNVAVERQLGVSVEALIGKTPLEMGQPLEEAEFACRASRQALETGEQQIVEQGLPTPFGRKHFATRIVPERDEQGSIESLLAVTRDITERREAEEALRQSEERFRRVSEATSDFAYSCVKPPGGSFAFDWLTGAVERITGWSRDEVLERGCWETLVLEEDVPLFEERVTGLAPGESGVCELRIRDKQGGVRWLAAYSAAEYDAQDPAVHRLHGACQDISERKQAEEALRESEERLRDITFSMADWVWETDENGVYTYCSQKGLDLLGPSRGDVVGKTPFDFMPADEAKRVAAIFSEIVARKAPMEDLENWTIAKNGERLCLLTNGVPLLDEKGNLKGYRGVDKDITERKRAEDAQRESEEKYRLAMEATRDGLWDWSIPTDEVFYSPGWKRILALHDELSDYDAWASRIHPEDRQTVLESLTRHLEGLTEQWEQEHRLRTGDGDWKWVLGRGTVVARDAEGKPLRMVGTMTDITERKQAEDEIRRQAEQLRRTVEGAVLAMSLVVETRDPYTAGHERRVSELATAIAAEMGMNGDALEALRLGGLIHDVGKIAVPAEILSKPGRLSEIELNLIKQHPASGFEILGAIDFGLPVAEMVLQHHERLDGSGYPRGLAGDDVLPEARILAVADVVEAMSSHRPYRPALGMAAALDEVREHAGVKYDAAVVATCVRLVEEQGFAFSEA